MLEKVSVDAASEATAEGDEGGGGVLEKVPKISASSACSAPAAFTVAFVAVDG